MAQRKRESGLSLEEISQLSDLVNTAIAYKAHKEEQNQARLLAQRMDSGNSLVQNVAGQDPAMMDKAKTPDSEGTQNGLQSRGQQQQYEAQAATGAQESREDRSRRTVSPITPPPASQPHEVNGHSAANAPLNYESATEPKIDYAGLLHLVNQARDFYATKKETAQAASQGDMANRRSPRNTAKSPAPPTTKDQSTPLPSVKSQTPPPKRKATQPAAARTSKRTKTNASKTNADDHVSEALDAPSQSNSPSPAAPSARSRAATPARSTTKRKVDGSATPPPQPKRAKTADKEVRPQLGSDSSKPGLIMLKVSSPLEIDFKGKPWSPETKGVAATPTAVVGQRPIDLTPQSTRHDGAYEVPHTNDDRLSRPRHQLNKTVTPHLLDAMRYVATHEPAKPLQWISETLKARSELVEGAWIDNFHGDNFPFASSDAGTVTHLSTTLEAPEAPGNPTTPNAPADTADTAITPAPETQVTVEPTGDISASKSADAGRKEDEPCADTVDDSSKISTADAVSTPKASEHAATPSSSLKTTEDFVGHESSSTSAPAESTLEITSTIPISKHRMRPGQSRDPQRGSITSLPKIPTAVPTPIAPTNATSLFDKLMNQTMPKAPVVAAPAARPSVSAPLTIEERLRKLQEESDKLEQEELAAAEAAAASPTISASSDSVVDETAASDTATPFIPEAVDAGAEAAAGSTQGHVALDAQDEALAVQTAWHKAAEDWSELDDELFGESPVDDTFPEV